MSQQGGRSGSEDYPRSQRIFPGWVWPGVLLTVLALVICGLIYVLTEARYTNYRNMIIPYGKDLVHGSLMYSADFDDHLQLAENWEVALKPYISDPDFVAKRSSPSTEKMTRFGMNQNLAGKNVKNLSDLAKTPAFFMTYLPGPSAFGGEKEAGIVAGDKAMIALMDGSARSLTKEQLAARQWTAPVKSPSK